MADGAGFYSHFVSEFSLAKAATPALNISEFFSLIVVEVLHSILADAARCIALQHTESLACRTYSDLVLWHFSRESWLLNTVFSEDSRY